MKARTSLQFAEGGSLILMPIDAENDAVTLFQDVKPMRHNLRFHTRHPKEETFQAFLTFMKWHEEDPSRDCWTIRLSANGIAVGVAWLYPSNFPEVAMWVLPKWHGTQVFLETMFLLFEAAFGPYGYHRVQITYCVDNLQVKRLIERMGVPIEGVLREGFDNEDGTYSDLEVTGLLRREWFAQYVRKSPGRGLINQNFETA